MPEITTKYSKLYEIFCISKCIQWINENKFSKVAVQIPCENHDNSLFIAVELRKATQSFIFEVTKSPDSCCPHFLDACKQKADAIIHFGETCLSQSNTLPVLYVLAPSSATQLEKINESILDMGIPAEEKLIFVFDTCNAGVSDQIYTSLKRTFSNIITSSVEPPEHGCLVHQNSCIQYHNNSVAPTKTSFNGRIVSLCEGSSISDYNFIYYGSSAKSLSVLRHRFSESVFYHIDNSCATTINKDSVKLVMCRSRKIELIKEATWIGIIFGTTTITGVTDMANRMRHLIKYSSKRATSIILIDMNENKLANFRCDIFVYINCPQSTIFDRLEDGYIYQKLVTPWEIEVALNPNFQWSLNFELNFSQFLPGNELHTELPSMPSTDLMETCADSMTALSIKNDAAISLASTVDIRSDIWRGLDPNFTAQTDINEIICGRKGIALSYENEGT